MDSRNSGVTSEVHPFAEAAAERAEICNAYVVVAVEVEYRVVTSIAQRLAERLPETAKLGE